MKTLSIITVNKNNTAGLNKTIKSVVCQTSNDYEYIIIDGASNDSSVEVIKKYSDKIDYWVSEPDTGIYNAMNKGIRKAKGKYCLFLNSGDWLVSTDTLENVFNEICNNDTDIFFSDAKRSDNTFSRFPKYITPSVLIQMRISHQNTLIKRSLFLEHGFYNENLKICSDYEFFLNELLKHKIIYTKIKTNISIFDVHGISSTNHSLMYAEDILVFQNVFNEFSDIVSDYNITFSKYRELIKNDAYNISLIKLYKILIKRSINKIFQLLFSIKIFKY